MYKDQIKNYLSKHSLTKLKLKTVLFDMDGVLFDSMPNHAKAWQQVMEEHDMSMTAEEVYLNEGRTGKGTVNEVSLRTLGKEASDEEVEQIYQRKSEIFNTLPEAERMKGAYSLLLKVKSEGLTPMIVTGSGQRSLLEKLEHNFPHTFTEDKMVTAFDVKHGKPDPEPYLMALKKGGFNKEEAIVIENAPLGVRSAVAAGIFTVAVNTGPLDDSVLVDAGADNWDLLQNNIHYWNKKNKKRSKK